MNRKYNSGGDGPRGVVHRATAWLVLIAWSVTVLISPVGFAGSPVPAGKPAHFPSWWFGRDVIPRIDTNNATPSWTAVQGGPADYPAPNDFSPVNIGQLKHIATKAAAEMHDRFSAGEGNVISGMIAAWSDPAGAGVVRNDYAAVNLGQLKAVAKPFYDRLEYLGFDTRASLIAHGYPASWLHKYPWDPAGTAAENYALVNQGQLKVAFSFDFNPPVETGLKLWLDAGQQISKDGAGLVSAWGDASGMGNNATQTTATNQPVWIDNVINGRPVLRFDGQNDKLLTVVAPSADDFTIFVVAQTSATHEIDTESSTGTAGTSGQKYLFGAKSLGGNAGAGMSLGTNGLSIYEHGDNYMPALLVYSGAVGNGFVLAEVQYQAKRPTLFLNGQLVRAGLSSPRPQVFAPTEIGAGDFGAFAGDVAEVMVYNRALTVAERATIEAYLSRKYALHIIPEVTITDPQTGSSFSTERVDVHGHVVHASLLESLIVNGVRALVTGNSFEARNVLLQPGTNTIVAIATDVFGHVGSASISIGQGPAPVNPVTLQVNATSGFGPLSVTFQTLATVPGQLVEVRYDFDGDGVIDQVRSNLDPITYLYSLAGDFFPVVTVVTTAGSFSSVGGFFADSPDAIAIHIQQAPQQESLTSIVDPVDVKAMTDGSLYVLSKSSARVTQFNAAGQTVRSITSVGLNPSGFDVDSAGRVYVALTGNNQVLRLKPVGATFTTDTLFNTTGKIGRADGAGGTASGEFNQPYDVAVTSDGQHIYVSDTGNHRVQKFSSDGQFLGLIGEAGALIGQFNAPKGLVFDSDESLFVADSGNNRIALINADAVTGTVGAQGSGPVQFQAPTNVSADATKLYVADVGNNRIVALNRPNEDMPQYTSRWISTGVIALAQANSVAAAGTLIDDRIYIADTANNQIQKFLLPKPSPTPAWTNARGSLVAGNIEGALANFARDKQPDFRTLFTSLGNATVTEWLNEIGQLTPVYINETFAQFRFVIDESGTPLTFLVTFVKENGQWKIMDF